MRQAAVERKRLIEEEIAVIDVAIDQLQRLHGGEKRSNIGSNMQAQTEGQSRATRISSGRSTIESASREAAVAQNLTDGKIATITGASRQAVQKWHTGKMAIPKRHAEKLKAEGIPLASWRRIAD